jgi:uncharacterized surface protein with fasciclin (FAS1) repeats
MLAKNRKLFMIVLLALALMMMGGIVYAAEDIKISIDGNMVESDVPPVILQDRTMVPIRVIAEYFGADVNWMQDTRTVVIASPPKAFLNNFQQKGMYIKQASDVLAAYNNNKNSLSIVDVRPAELRAEGFIEGSMGIPLPALADKISAIPKDKMVAVYCASDINAAYGTAILNMAGYDAYVMQGGQEAWVRAGGPMAADIVDTAIAAGNFTALAAALQAADLVDTLKGPGPFTVFAPTDAAFAALPAGTLESLLLPENKETLQSILKYHVVPGAVMAADVVKLSSATTLQGQDVSIHVENGSVMVEVSNVVATDIVCKNGIIHVIDAVMMPK